MTAVRLSRLSRPGVFESIAPKRLFALLQPFADFFANRSVLIDSPDSIDCQAVIREITHADRETPADLLDAICLIDELANTVAMELLLDRVSTGSLGLELGGEHSEADIVTAAWLTNREKLVQTHGLSRIKRARSYDYYQASQTTAPKFVTPAEETLQQLEKVIDSWHVERFRAQGTKVEVFEKFLTLTHFKPSFTAKKPTSQRDAKFVILLVTTLKGDENGLSETTPASSAKSCHVKECRSSKLWRVTNLFASFEARV